MIVQVFKGKPNYDISIETPVGINQMGNPVYDKLIIEGGSYDSVDNKTGEAITVEYERIELNDVRLSVALQKNIVVTKINKRNGNIKEFISNGDYEITVSGSLVSVWQFKPKVEIKKLNEIFKAETELTIYSDLLNDDFGISQIVIVGNPIVSEVEGSRNTLSLNFRAISYEEITLEVLDA